MEDIKLRVVNSIQRRLGSLPPLSPNCCIYRVPENLRKVNEDAYRPLVVSIGPFYYLKDPKLQAMQEQKLRYLQSFLRRNNAYNVGHYVEVITGREQVIRHCYAEHNNMLDSEGFIEMVLVDAAFIIELFFRECFHQYVDENDRIFNKPRMLLEITRDIRLEENQLPFFVLKELYGLAFGSAAQNGHLQFVDLTYRFLMEKNKLCPAEIATMDFKHIVDFLRECHLPSSKRKEHTVGFQTVVISTGLADPRSGDNADFKQTFVFPPSVTELSEAGVKFKVRKSKDLLDIKFDKGVLEIPRLVVTDHTESLFRNIMVFEQCHYYFDSYIIDYFAFLDWLIDTPKDVEILVQNGIIENWLGSNEEVARLFNEIFKQTRMQDSNFYYDGVCKDLNAFARRSWHRYKAILKHNYFNHPWAALSVTYAIVILVLTVLQAISGFTK